MRLVRTALAAVVFATGALAGETPSPPEARVYFVEPLDGATVTNPVRIVFGLEGMGIAPAGVGHENTGHHHLLINTSADAVDFEGPLPADESHVHFGGGQTEASVELPPGTHVLRLMLADHNHIPHEPPVYSEPITVTVE